MHTLLSARYRCRSTRLDPFDLIRLPRDGLLHLLLKLGNLVFAKVVTCVPGDAVLLPQLVNEGLALLEGLGMTLWREKG